MQSGHTFRMRHLDPAPKKKQNMQVAGAGGFVCALYVAAAASGVGVRSQPVASSVSILLG